MQLEYDIRDDKTAVITRIPQPEAVIVLPSFVEGCPVTEIGTDVISLGKNPLPGKSFCQRPLSKSQKELLLISAI